MCYANKLSALGFSCSSSRILNRHENGVPSLIVEVWVKPGVDWYLVYRGGSGAVDEWTIEDDAGIIIQRKKFSELEKSILERVLTGDELKRPILEDDGLKDINANELKVKFIDFTDYLLNRWSFIQVGKEKGGSKWLLFRHRELYDVKLLFNEATSRAVIKVPNRQTWRFRNAKALMEIEALPDVFGGNVSQIEYL